MYNNISRDKVIIRINIHNNYVVKGLITNLDFYRYCI